MTPLRRLRSFLSPTKSISGTVMSVSRNTAQVATSRGTVTAIIPQDTFYRPKDTVLIVDGVIVGRSRCIQDLPCYIV